MSDPVRRMIDRVALRQEVCAVARRAFVIFVVLAGLFLLGVMLTRFLGLAPGGFRLWQATLIPVLSLAFALLPVPRRRRLRAARAIDDHLGTEDLYLTAGNLDNALGGYQDLVRRDAAEALARVRPAGVVPFGAPRRGAVAAALATGVVLGVLFLPSFDPFGIEEARLELQRRLEEREQLVEFAKREHKRLEAAKVDAPHAPEVTEALAKLEEELRALKRDKPERNEDRLKRQSGKLGGLYKRNQEDRGGEELRRQARKLGQQFGARHEFDQELQKMLGAGDDSDLQKKLDAMSDDARRLAQEKDPAERRKLKRKLQKALKGLQRAAGQRPGMQGLSRAAQQALEQLALSELDGFDPQSLQGLRQTLELSKLQASKLAQTMRDAQALEDAMKLVKQAQGCCKKGNCPGAGQLSKAQSLAALQKLFGQGQGQGQGQGGTGGPGQGRGGRPPEAQGVTANYQDDLAESALRAGKILMQWRAKEVSPKGEMKRQYVQALTSLSESAGEAIVNEDVPAGYHEAIKGYFDTLRESADTDLSADPP